MHIKPKELTLQPNLKINWKVSLESSTIHNGVTANLSKIN